MTVLRFGLETTTALFMHGSRGPEYSDLRASAIKGIIRHWFRALAGQGQGSDALRLAEAEVFGTTGDPSPRLSVSVKLPALYRDVSTHESSPLPHKPEAAAGKDGKFASSLKPGTQFEITLTGDESRRNGERNLELAGWSLWTAIALGGLGGRSRRGCGSVKLLSADSPFPVAPELADYTAVAKHIESGLAAACSAFAAAELRRPHSEPQLFPVISTEIESTCLMVAPFGGKNEAETRADLMLKLREFKNPAFGLPLKLDKEWVKPESSIPGASRMRHASPVRVRLVPTGAGWAAVLSFLAPCPDAPGRDVARVRDFYHSFGSETAEIKVT